MADDTGISFLAAEGSPEQYVVRLRRVDEKRLDLVSYGAASPDGVDTLASQLRGAGVRHGQYQPGRPGQHELERECQPATTAVPALRHPLPARRVAGNRVGARRFLKVTDDFREGSHLGDCLGPRGQHPDQPSDLQAETSQCLRTGIPVLVQFGL